MTHALKLAPHDALTLAVEFVNSARRQMRRYRDEEPRCVWMSSRLWAEIEASPYLMLRGHGRQPCAGCRLAGVEVRFSDDPHRDPAFDPERDLVLEDAFAGVPSSAPRVDG